MSLKIFFFDFTVYLISQTFQSIIYAINFHIIRLTFSLKPELIFYGDCYVCVSVEITRN